MTKRTQTEVQQELRNVGIIAHIDAGKTTLTERMLFYSGRIHQPGEVHHGTTEMDSDPLEQKKGITINAAAIQFDWEGADGNQVSINLVDTPGHVDFTVEVERSMRVLGGAVLVVDAVAGVEPQTETVWAQADRYQVARIAFVNKLDRKGADVDACLASMKKRLGARPVLLTLPLGVEEDFVGVADILTREGIVYDEHDRGRQPRAIELDDKTRAELEVRREALIDVCAEVSDTVAERYLADGDVSAELLIEALRTGVERGVFLPVLCGSAFKYRAVQPLLDAICALLPSPSATPRSIAVADPTEPEQSEALSALVFKVAHDDHGPVAWVRVYRGTLQSGQRVSSTTNERPLRIGRLVKMAGRRQEPIETVEAGDIAAVVGLACSTGTTLYEGKCEALEPVQIPTAVLTLALEPKRQGHEEKLSGALRKMVMDDPSLVIGADEQTGRLTISGMGELHLEVALDRLRRDHKIEVAAGAPSVSYREGIAHAATYRNRLKKQTGGPGTFAEVEIRVEPQPEGFTFVSEVKGASVPSEYIAAVEKGAKRALAAGVFGWAVDGVRCVLLDGASHANDSSDRAFEMCGEMAMRHALEGAGAFVLEPVMTVCASAPDDEVGNVVADLSRRRGKVTGIEHRANRSEVNATVPLAATFGLADALRGVTHGRSTLHLAFLGYERAPDEVTSAMRR